MCERGADSTPPVSTTMSIKNIRNNITKSCTAPPIWIQKESQSCVIDTISTNANHSDTLLLHDF